MADQSNEAPRSQPQAQDKPVLPTTPPVVQPPEISPPTPLAGGPQPQIISPTQSTIWDVLIIGAGPAGLTAAIYTTRKKLKTLVVSKDIGGQAAISGDIENYLGYTMVTGPELAEKFRHHVENFEELDLEEGVEIVALEKKNDHFLATDRAGKVYEGRAVIICSGRNPRLLGVPGEKEFLGRGVATCATCDAPLFAGRDVAVVGGGNSAMDAALALSKVANKVYILNINPELAGDEILKKNLVESGKMEHFGNAQATRILADKLVTGIEFKDKTSGETKTLSVSGVFIEIGQIPSVDFDRLTEKDQWNEIKVDPDTMMTSIPGIFAAGDVNDQWGEQIIIAAGEGSKAALRAAEYLARLPK